MAIKLFNTLSRKLEEVAPVDGKTVRFYACGPTVYKSQHVGNYRTYLYEDILRRALVYAGYSVRHAMNITDVGHLVGDTDGGEDKFDVSAREQNKNPLDIARFYQAEFLDDLSKLNIQTPESILPATEAIPEQLELIALLLQKGFAYKTPLAIYFDTTKLADYGKLTGQKLEEKQTAVRSEVVEDPEKRNPRDFALWFFLAGRYANHALRWNSMWGEGFPGWHIECSAISRKLLGQPFDIHAGGVDHIGTHHTNEIAQSEAGYGTPLATIWVHGEHLDLKEKMSKSLGNVILIRDIIERGFDPLSLRYLTFLTHYRQKIIFSWESLEQAQSAYYHMLRAVSLLGGDVGVVDPAYRARFLSALENDLGMPEALAVAWELLKDDTLDAQTRRATILDFDRVLGLDLLHASQDYFNSVSGTPEAEALLSLRNTVRAEKDFAKADEIRDKLLMMGYEIEDGPQGSTLRKRR